MSTVRSKVTALPRWALAILSVLLALIVIVGICEALGWPFLVGPLQHKLAQVLHRKVEFGTDPDVPEARIGLLGSVRVHAARIEIGAPEWSQAPHTFLATDASLRLRYRDLWHLYRGGALRIDDLEAASFDGRLERLADGKASWQFGPTDKAKAAADGSTPMPTFGSLRIGQGALTLRDAMLPASVDANFSLADASRSNGGDVAQGASSSPSAAAAASSADGLRFKATGTYRNLPLKIDLDTAGVLALVSEGAAAPAQRVTIDAVIGRAHLKFNGSATDPVHLAALRGTFSIAGPSLAAVGDPLGVTLPTTPAFSTSGFISKDGGLWKAVFGRAEVGSSRLTGAFVFDKRGALPILSGRVDGPRLVLADLAPAVGGANPSDSISKKVNVGKAAAVDDNGKIIPDRQFDLPSLRVMNANVLFNIGYLDLGTKLLEPLRPMRAHLTLADGVLRIDDVDARTAEGSLSGSLQLDGRQSTALWDVDLGLRGVRLDQWLHQTRGEGAPPYVSGKLDGQVKVAGRGRSTAEILASLNGGMRFHVRDGTLSHLAVEAMGIDFAQALGMLVKGDEALKIQCNIVDLAVDKGVARPKVFVINTSDSTVWVDGTVSLRSEALDLRAVVSPKDFSPFALRTPIHLKGTFSKPAVSLETGKLAARAGAAILLSLLNPIAALIPFIDTGSKDAAESAAKECSALVARSRLPLADPKSPKAPGTK